MNVLLACLLRPRISFLFCGILTASSLVLVAQEPAAPADPTDASTPALKATPQVAIDVLMVWLPEEKGLPLLPELRDPKRLEATQKRILEMIARKEATLIDWPEVVTQSGNRAVSESIVEFRYPVEYVQPAEHAFSNKTVPLTAAETAVHTLMKAGVVVPNGFETKNTGATFEIEPIVSRDGKSVDMNLSVQAVNLERMADVKVGKDPNGQNLSVQQPIFRTHKVQTNITLRDNQRRLLFVGKPLEPDGRIVIFIIGARIIPAIPIAAPTQPSP